MWISVSHYCSRISKVLLAIKDDKQKPSAAAGTAVGGVWGVLMALAAVLSLAAVAASAAEFKPSPYLPPLLVFEVCRRLFLPSHA